MLHTSCHCNNDACSIPATKDFLRVFPVFSCMPVYSCPITIILLFIFHVFVTRRIIYFQTHLHLYYLLFLGRYSNVKIIRRSDFPVLLVSAISLWTYYKRHKLERAFFNKTPPNRFPENLDHSYEFPRI